MTNSSRLLVLGTAALLLLAGACTADAPRVEATADETAAPGWAMHRLGPGASDTRIVGVRLPDGTVSVVTIAEPAALHGWIVGPDGVDEVPVTGAPDADHRVLTSIAAGAHGLVAVGYDIPAFQPFVLRSRDGSEWSHVETAGLDVSAELDDVAVTDRGIVAVGTLRTAEDPSHGGFIPVVFTSTDGVTWTRAATPSTAEGTLHSLAATTEGLIATGRAGGPITWTSENGEVWVAGEPVPTEFEPGGVVALDDELFVLDGGFEGSPATIVHSGDAGASWTPTTASFPKTLQRASLVGDGTHLWLLGARTTRVETTPDDCYIDIARCRPTQGSTSESLLFRSTDGSDWAMIDLDGLDDLSRPHEVLTTSNGDTVILGDAVGGSWGAWVWSADNGALPTTELSPIGQYEGAYDGPPMADPETPLQSGVTLRQPVGGHCGAEYLGTFNGSTWRLSDTPAGRSPTIRLGEAFHDDSVPDDWPVVGQVVHGFITLVDPDTIEYSIRPDGTEVIAIYERVDEPIPACG